MLNMQNVKDIEITEGKVRTIHDKDNRLIWGRLAYDTKYAGDTYQQTYGGKNLFNGEYVQYAVGGSLNNIWFSNASTRSAVIKCQPNTMYTITKFDPSNRFVVADYPSVPPSDTQINTLVINNTATTLTVTTNSDAEYLFIYVSGQNEEPRMQVELGSSPTSYEPYVGGIPAPNPDYPQDVQVVTGEQTVTISDGVDSEDFAISLGTIELCKIGNYQDYIYKSGDDWYVHRETNKTVYSSSSGWSLGGTYDDYQGFYASQYTMVVGRNTPIYTNYFKQVPYVVPSQSPLTEECFMINANSSNSTMIFYSKIITSLSELNDYFSTTPMSFYFPLKTPVDTQITDATLLGQLEAVHEWLTRYGYNATVTGTLPIIINQTNL